MENKKLVYTATPKYIAAMNPYIGKYVYEQDCIPITPWQYPFWLMDSVDRDKIREGNERYIDEADEVWVFSTKDIFKDSEKTIEGLDIQDGMAREIEQAKDKGKPVKLHRIDEDSQEIEFVREL